VGFWCWMPPVANGSLHCYSSTLSLLMSLLLKQSLQMYRSLDDPSRPTVSEPRRLDGGSVALCVLVQTCGAAPEPLGSKLVWSRLRHTICSADRYSGSLWLDSGSRVLREANPNEKDVIFCEFST
jgi:hypothetical protein